MEEEKRKKKSKWRKNYRMVLTNLETLEAEYRVSFSGVQLLILAGGLFFTLFLIFYGLVGFTPLKRALPGFYAQIESSEIIKLRELINGMESQMQEQDAYILSLRSLLSGKPIDSLQKNDKEIANVADNAEPGIVERVKEDDELRENIERKERLDALRTSFNPDMTSQQRLDLEEVTLFAPVIGPIGKKYDPSENHFGIDILASKNTAIKSIASGMVLQSDWSVETGNSIMILHDNGLISVYKHNSSLLKSNYERVQAGEAVAIIGNTGTLSTGPHLHFEIWENGRPKDPTEYINFK